MIFIFFLGEVVNSIMSFKNMSGFLWYVFDREVLMACYIKEFKEISFFYKHLVSFR